MPLKKALPLLFVGALLLSCTTGCTNPTTGTDTDVSTEYYNHYKIERTVLYDLHGSASKVMREEKLEAITGYNNVLTTFGRIEKTYDSSGNLVSSSKGYYQNPATLKNWINDKTASQVDTLQGFKAMEKLIDDKLPNPWTLGSSSTSSDDSGHQTIITPVSPDSSSGDSAQGHGIAVGS